MNVHDAVIAMASVGTFRRGFVTARTLGKLPSLACVKSIRDAVYSAPSTEETEALITIQLKIVAMTGIFRLLMASTKGLELVPALAQGDMASRTKIPITNRATTMPTV